MAIWGMGALQLGVTSEGYRVWQSAQTAEKHLEEKHLVPRTGTLAHPAEAKREKDA